MNTKTDIDETFELMQQLIEYRYQKALHHRLMKAADHSMLDIDVLVLIYHMAKMSQGAILEIGSFLGASTIAAGLGARDSGKLRKFLSIEPGGRLTDHRLATKDIFGTSKRTCPRADCSGPLPSLTPRLSTRKLSRPSGRTWGPARSDLFIFDADANVRRDIDCYGDRFADRCWVVIDDYISATDKGGPTRTQVDELVAAGRLLPLGILRLGDMGRPLARLISENIFTPQSA